MKYDNVIKDKEDLLIILRSMERILGLSQTEKNALNKSIDYINENDNSGFASRILNMIDANGATAEDIRQFCENFIKSKEEEC